MTSSLPDTQKTTDERWRFWRDVLVFELKMFIGNLRDFALMPVSVGAAMIDLVSKGEREGSLFYRVLRWARMAKKFSTPTARSEMSCKIERSIPIIRWTRSWDD